MENRAAAPPPRLITFPPSVDSETARWILGHHRAPFVERRHSLFGCLVLGRWYGGLVPLYVARGSAAVATAKGLLDHLEASASPASRLVPASLETPVRAAFDESNGVLGTAMAQWVYFYVLADRSLAHRLVTEGVPFAERAIDAIAFPLVVLLMRKGLGNLDAGVAAKALATCKTILDRVDESLADGRSFLIGDRLSAADVAFCAASAPLFLNPLYGGALPTLEEVAPEMRAEVLRFRARPSCAFVDRLYRELRSPAAPG